MNTRKKIYFASDLHLGIPNFEDSLRREKLFIQWIKTIRNDAEAIYLLGDIFDYWFEYKRVVPKGFVRLLGTLAETIDMGIPIHYFAGNHDLWIRNYLKEEIGVIIHKDRLLTSFSGKSFFIAHGDGLGPRDHGYKIMKKVIGNSFSKWLYARFHPDFSVWLANYFSKKSRYSKGGVIKGFQGEDKEWLIVYAKQKLETEDINYFIFGHRHLALDVKLSEKSRYINLGDWLTVFSFAVFDGNDVSLKYFEKEPDV